MSNTTKTTEQQHLPQQTNQSNQQPFLPLDSSQNSIPSWPYVVSYISSDHQHNALVFVFLFLAGQLDYIAVHHWLISSTGGVLPDSSPALGLFAPIDDISTNLAFSQFSATCILQIPSSFIDSFYLITSSHDIQQSHIILYISDIIDAIEILLRCEAVRLFATSFCSNVLPSLRPVMSMFRDKHNLQQPLSLFEPSPTSQIVPSDSQHIEPEQPSQQKTKAVATAASTPQPNSTKFKQPIKSRKSNQNKSHGNSSYFPALGHQTKSAANNVQNTIFSNASIPPSTNSVWGTNQSTVAQSSVWGTSQSTVTQSSVWDTSPKATTNVWRKPPQQTAPVAVAETATDFCPIPASKTRNRSTNQVPASLAAPVLSTEVFSKPSTDPSSTATKIPADTDTSVVSQQPTVSQPTHNPQSPPTLGSSAIPNLIQYSSNMSSLNPLTQTRQPSFPQIKTCLSKSTFQAYFVHLLAILFYSNTCHTTHIMKVIFPALIHLCSVEEQITTFSEALIAHCTAVMISHPQRGNSIVEAVLLYYEQSIKTLQLLANPSHKETTPSDDNQITNSQLPCLDMSLFETLNTTISCINIITAHAFPIIVQFHKPNFSPSLDNMADLQCFIFTRSQNELELEYRSVYVFNANIRQMFQLYSQIESLLCSSLQSALPDEFDHLLIQLEQQQQQLSDTSIYLPLLQQLTDSFHKNVLHQRSQEQKKNQLDRDGNTPQSDFRLEDIYISPCDFPSLLKKTILAQNSDSLQLESLRALFHAQSEPQSMFSTHDNSSQQPQVVPFMIYNKITQKSMSPFTPLVCQRVSSVPSSDNSMHTLVPLLNSDIKHTSE